MKKIVIFDLDGTLSDPTHRLPLIQGNNKNWDLFYEQSALDPPIWQGIDLLNMYFNNKYFVWIYTGRSISTFVTTSAWLSRFEVKYHVLKMRDLNDHTPGWVLKHRWLQEWAVSLDDPENAYQMIKVVVDDDIETCRMFQQKLGIPTFHILPGALDESNT